ncbi:MAG: tetratricopeptide repeat protein, partial [bacterium]|nr:tetratricopeptide repeat protein [bacterium]
QYYGESLRLKEKTGDKGGMASVNNNLGNVYSALGSYNKALQYYKASLQTKERGEEPRSVAGTINNIGNIYRKMGKYDLAMECYGKSLSDRKAIGDRRGVAGTLEDIGTLLVEKKEIRKALPYLQKALKAAGEIGAKDLVCDCYYQLYLLYSLEKDYKKTLHFHEKYWDIKYSIESGELTGRISQMEKNLKIEITEQEIEILKKDRAIRELLLKRRRFLIYLLVGGLIFALVLAFAGFRLYRQKKKAHEDLEMALGELNTLGGLLPICAKCKKIRDDKGYWHQVEEFIRDNSHTQFSHGICPECIQVFYPKYANSLKKEESPAE